MEDLHGRTGLVDEDEGITVLYAASHLVGYDAAERVEVLAHVRRMRVQEEPDAVVQAEHPLPGQQDETAQHLHRNVPVQTHGDAVRETDLTGGLLGPE